MQGNSVFWTQQGSCTWTHSDRMRKTCVRARQTKPQRGEDSWAGDPTQSHGADDRCQLLEEGESDFSKSVVPTELTTHPRKLEKSKLILVDFFFLITRGQVKQWGKGGGEYYQSMFNEVLKELIQLKATGKNFCKYKL